METAANRHPGGAHESRIKQVPLVCGVAAGTLGAIALAGWVFEIELLTRFVPGLPDLKALTAIGIVGLGVALPMVQPGRPIATARAGRAIGAAVVGLGIVLIFEYVFGGIGIDELLFDDPGSADYPGRPSPQTAVGFVAAGLAIATVDTDPPRFRGTQVTTAALWALIIVSLVGYVFQLEDLREVSDSTGISVITLLSLGLVATGLTVLRPERGLLGFLRSDDQGALAARAILPPALLAPLVIGTVGLAAVRLELVSFETAVALMVLSAMAVFLAVVWTASVRLSAADARRGQAERERVELEAVSSQLPVAFYRAELGEHGNWLYASPQIERLLGYPAERWREDPAFWASALHPDDRERALAEEARDLEKPPGEPFSSEYRMIGADGRILWIRDQGIASDGKVVEGVLTDITEQKDAEERFRRLLEAAPDPIVIVDSQGTIQLANAAVKKVLGYRPEELVGQAVEILVPEAARANHAAHRETFHASPEARPMGTGLELFARRRDGTQVPAEISLSPMESEHGTLVIAAIRDVTRQRKAEQTLRHMAEHDPLTGLLNRRRFEEELERTIAAADRYETPAAVLLFDVDELKRVNDTLGHAAGDELLVAVANTIRERLRSTDVIARLGGDEYAAILTHAGLEEARSVASDLLRKIESEAGITADPEFRPSASIGIAIVQPDAPATPARLLSHADIAMYAAKRAGRNRYAAHGENGDVTGSAPDPPRGRRPAMTGTSSGRNTHRSGLD